MKYQYLIHPEPDKLVVVHIASDCTVVGHARRQGGKYCVETDQGDKVAVVKSIGEVIPALLDHREKHPAQWQGDEATGYSKLAHFGDVRVERDQSGSWTASRNDGFALLRDGKPAEFDTARDARRAAETHLRDGYPDSSPIADGFTWEHDPLLEVWSAL